MSASPLNFDRIAQDLGRIARDLDKALDQWDPLTAREVMRELARVMAVLQQIYPEPEWDPEDLNRQML